MYVASKLNQEVVSANGYPSKSTKPDVKRHQYLSHHATMPECIKVVSQVPTNTEKSATLLALQSMRLGNLPACITFIGNSDYGNVSRPLYA